MSVKVNGIDWHTKHITGNTTLGNNTIITGSGTSNIRFYDTSSYEELAKDFEIELTDTQIERLDELKDSEDQDNKTIAATIFKSLIVRQMKEEWKDDNTK